MRAILGNPVVLVALWIVAVAATISILGPVVAYALGRRRLPAVPRAVDLPARDVPLERGRAAGAGRVTGPALVMVPA